MRLILRAGSLAELCEKVRDIAKNPLGAIARGELELSGESEQKEIGEYVDDLKGNKNYVA